MGEHPGQSPEGRASAAARLNGTAGASFLPQSLGRGRRPVRLAACRFWPANRVTARRSGSGKYGALDEQSQWFTDRMPQAPSTGERLMLTAGTVGLVHAAFTIYWAFGGRWRDWNLSPQQNRNKG